MVWLEQAFGRQDAIVQQRKTYKYRLYHSRRNKRLHRRIDIAGLIWNHMVALQRRTYRLTCGYINRYRMQKHLAKLRRNVSRFDHWQMVGSQAVQELAERHDRAYQRFFAYKRGEGARHGRPRFKKVKQYTSFTLKQAGWKYEGGNRVTIQGTTYKFSLSRPVVGEIKTVTVKRDRVGHLWVCFSVVMERDWPEPGEASTGKSGGFDFGLRTFMTDHEGHAYRSPQFLKAELNEIARLNRELSRKEKGSHNRRKAKRRLARAHARIANKRRDAVSRSASETEVSPRALRPFRPHLPGDAEPGCDEASVGTEGERPGLCRVFDVLQWLKPLDSWGQAETAARSGRLTSPNPAADAPAASIFNAAF